jgi:hypothetical protein
VRRGRDFDAMIPPTLAAPPCHGHPCGVTLKRGFPANSRKAG